MLPLDPEPEWIDEWTIILDENDENGHKWVLKEGAPPEIKEKFKQYIEDYVDGYQW